MNLIDLKIDSSNKKKLTNNEEFNNLLIIAFNNVLPEPRNGVMIKQKCTFSL